MPDPQPADRGPSRREFIKTAGAGGLLTGAVASGTAPAAAQTTGEAAAVVHSGEQTITLTVNGQARQVVVEPRTTLLEALRDHRGPGGEAVDETAPKSVCDRGSCGACTVLLSGKPVYACSVLALEAADQPIATAAGLGLPDHLHPLQQAFVDHDALQCGFCTPGFVVAAAALLERNREPSRAEIQEALDGNVCRCGTYQRIFEAVADAAARLRGGN